MPTTSRSARGVVALQTAKLREAQLEDELEHARAEIRRLEVVELPSAFTEDGISELRLPDGQRAVRNVSVQGSFPNQETEPEAHRRAVTEWARLGYADTLRCAVTSSYGAGDREAALAAYEALRGDNRAFVTLRETVHHSTLRAAVLARIRAGEPTSVEDLGCAVIRRVRLTTPPRRRAVESNQDQVASQPTIATEEEDQ